MRDNAIYLTHEDIRHLQIILAAIRDDSCACSKVARLLKSLDEQVPADYDIKLKGIGSPPPSHPVTVTPPSHEAAKAAMEQQGYQEAAGAVPRSVDAPRAEEVIRRNR